MASSFSYRRYTDRPFPPYRYVPGLHPHPTADPRGHSYTPPGCPPGRHEALDPEAWATCAEYLYGCDLYNHAYWWEAHEAWEGQWRLARAGTAERSFLQGLIQTSACHLQLQLGSEGGVRRLVKSGSAHLRAVPTGPGGEAYCGLRLEAFIRRVEDYYQQRASAAGAGAGHDAAQYPYIELAR